MPSPFPGMDPYLEEPGLWPDVHARLIALSSEFLGQALRPKYYVRIEERVYISDENDSGRTVMVPDSGSRFVPVARVPPSRPEGERWLSPNRSRRSP
jgi:Protein of unknown function (DUF4058)